MAIMGKEVPFFSGGSCSYEGHMCAPMKISDLYKVVEGSFWVNRENRQAALDMLQAAFLAGVELGKREASR